MMTTGAGILGTGVCLPEQLLTNEELASRFGITTEWIFERTGIRQRHIAAPHQACSDLAIVAARRALAAADTLPEEIGMVIVSTISGDYPSPATAALVQGALGIPGAICFDLSAACSGFVYGLVVGCHAVTCGFSRKVLLIGAEVLSRIVNPDDCDSVILFGDGAGAAVIGPVPDGFGLLATDAGTIGSEHEAIMVPAGGSRLPLSAEVLADQLQYVRMDGNQVFVFAMRILGNSAMRAMNKRGLTPTDIALFVPHQANRRIIEAAAGRLDLPLERFVVNLERIGNTSSASIPIALDETIRTGRIVHGDHLMLTGFGAGVSWGSALLRWHSPGSDQIHTKGDEP
ncbi:3-oxoacyl-ACP synthase III family protein [Pelobacter propionicus]|nr:beta-ketoacyl-ACP synthase III [Pelobacter propionicus]